jgi:hypothetical protein
MDLVRMDIHIKLTTWAIYPRGFYSLMLECLEVTDAPKASVRVQVRIHIWMSASIHVTTLMCTSGTSSEDGQGHLEYYGSLWGSWPTLLIHQNHANTMLSNRPNNTKHL